MEEKENTLFREKALEQIASPEKLNDYLRVTSPGIWAVLIAVIVLLAGIMVWATVGTLESRASAHVVVSAGSADVIPTENEQLSEGMTLEVSDVVSVIDSAEKDEYGRTVGKASVDLPDGTYEGNVIVEKMHPIKFLLESN